MPAVSLYNYINYMYVPTGDDAGDQWPLCERDSNKDPAIDIGNCGWEGSMYEALCA